MNNNKEAKIFTYWSNDINDIYRKTKILKKLKFNLIDDDIPGRALSGVSTSNPKWQEGPWHIHMNCNYHKTSDTIILESVYPGEYYIDLDISKEEGPLPQDFFKDADLVDKNYYFNKNNDFLEPVCRYSYGFIKEQGLIEGRWYVAVKDGEQMIFQSSHEGKSKIPFTQIRYASPSEITSELVRRGELTLKRNIYNFYENTIITC